MRNPAEIAEVRVPISSLVVSDSPRLSGEDSGHVRALAGSGTRFPPIIVQRSTMRVVDGMHRLRATELRGENMISVRYFEGDDKRAFVLAVKANVAHGLPLTSADREAAIRRITKSHPCWSDRAIASVTGCSAKTVAAIRACATEENAQLHTRIGLDGRARPIDAASGRRRASELIAANPNASLREIARAAGISPGTVRDVRQRLRAGKDPIPTRQSGYRKPPGRHREADIPSPRSPGEISVLPSLRRDPSLRFTEQGRVLLRLLEAHALNEREWEQLADNVPAHCVRTVSVMAREFTVVWHEFAEKLERRSRATT